MKISRLFSILAVALCVAAGIVSCKSKSTEGSGSDQACVSILTVETFIAEADSLVGDTVTVEGICSHLCKHGGRKAFLMSNDSTELIRCEATGEIGGAFSPDCPGKKLTVLGIVCEERLSEDDIRAMEEKHAATEGESDHACATEAKANGQDSISEFDARMADYRARINARAEKEGKDYLSFYYLRAIAYGVEQ